MTSPVDPQMIAAAVETAHALRALETSDGWPFFLQWLQRRVDGLAAEVLTSPHLTPTEREEKRQQRLGLTQMVTALEEDYQHALRLAHQHSTLAPDMVERITRTAPTGPNLDESAEALSPFGRPAQAADLKKHLDTAPPAP